MPETRKQRSRGAHCARTERSYSCTTVTVTVSIQLYIFDCESVYTTGHIPDSRKRHPMAIRITDLRYYELPSIQNSSYYLVSVLQLRSLVAATPTGSDTRELTVAGAQVQLVAHKLTAELEAAGREEAWLSRSPPGGRGGLML